MRKDPWKMEMETGGDKDTNDHSRCPRGPVRQFPCWAG